MFWGFVPDNSASQFAIAVIAFLLASVGLLSVRKKGFVQFARWLPAQARRQWVLCVSALLVSLPYVLSALLIAPRFHYLLIPCTILGVVAIAVLFRSDENTGMEHSHYTRRIGMALLLIVFLAALRPAAGDSWSGGRDQPNLATIRFLQSLAISRPVRCLEAEGGYGIYVGDNYARVAEYGKTSSFNLFRSENKINMVVVSKALRTDTRFAPDAEWEAFLSDPASFGFRSLSVPGVHERIVLASNDLLP
jgi:hypothetical protein